MEKDFPAYPGVVSLGVRILLSGLSGRKRSFQQDARQLLARLNPTPLALGVENIPPGGPLLVVCNHYFRPGFDAWWIAFTISACVPGDLRWVMTAERRYEGLKRGVVMRPLEKRYIALVARVYGFFSTPAIPPLPGELVRRAAAVRSVIEWVRKTPNPRLAIAPEGSDRPGGVLGWPPPGGGRFLSHLDRLGLPLLPVGVFEQDGRLQANFGCPFQLETRSSSREEEDQAAGRQIMSALARLLPPYLRGDF